MSIAEVYKRQTEEPREVRRADLCREMQRHSPSGPPDIGSVVVPVAGKADPFCLFDRYVGGKFQCDQWRGDGVAVHRITRHIRSGRETTAFVGSFPVDPCWLLAMTREDGITKRDLSDVVQHCIKKWIEVFYPDLVIVKPSAGELLDFLFRLDDTGEVRVFGSSLRYPGKGSQTTRHEEDLSAVVERIEGEGGFLNKASYQLEADHRTYCASVARDGVFHFHSGDVALFLEHVSSFVNRIQAQQERIEVSQPEDAREGLRAVDLSFPAYQVLGEESEEKKLVEVLESDSAFAVTVFHGNPYLHMEVFDLPNGSSFTVYSRDSSVLRVFPGPHASNVSLTRMVDRIRQEFAECEEAKVTLPL